MQKSFRFLARAILGDGLQKLSVVVLSSGQELLSVVPFTAETGQTKYYDGLLLIVVPSFDVSTVKDLIKRSAEISELITSTSYLQNRVYCGDRCSVYHISAIDWVDLCFTGESVVSAVIS